MNTTMESAVLETARIRLTQDTKLFFVAVACVLAAAAPAAAAVFTVSNDNDSGAGRCGRRCSTRRQLPVPT